MSVKDIYSAVKTGATLVVVPRRMFSAPAELIDFICDRRITVMIWAVSALCLISTFHALDYRTPETVNKILFSGEVMPLKALKLRFTIFQMQSMSTFTDRRKSPVTAHTIFSTTIATMQTVFR